MEGFCFLLALSSIFVGLAQFLSALLEKTVKAVTFVFVLAVLVASVWMWINHGWGAALVYFLVLLSIPGYYYNKMHNKREDSSWTCTE